MNYPIIRDFKLDINQEFEVNKIPNEHYELVDNQNVFVPRHAPFFMDSLVMRDAKGQPLVDGQDYRIFRMMGKLSALCATGVAALVEILNPNIKEFYYDYHAVGDSPLFDRSLIELINTAANDQRLIKWSNIHNKPVVFDPILHTHLLPYDMTLFQDVISFIDMWADGLDKASPVASSVALEAQTKIVKGYFERNAAMVKRALQRHAAQYNSHGLTDVQVNLDKVDNIPTATLDQAINGEANMRLTTSALEQIIKRYGYNSDAFLKSNVLPISFYGNTSFIPPAIGGSFEGLGSRSEGAAICLESDGTISYLSNHFDGRVEGLYFSIVTGYPNALKMNYQSYRYDHSVLTAAGVVPRIVAQGSGGEVLMVGNGQNWFVALTNGTLDPNYHTMCKLNITDFNKSFLSTSFLSVHLMGSYVVIIQAMNDPDTTKPNLGTSHKRIWRIPVSSFVSGNTLTPTAVALSFTNQDGKAFTNSNYFVWAEAVLDANGYATRLISKFTKPVKFDNLNSFFYRTAAAISTPIPNRSDAFILKFFSASYVPGKDDSHGVYQFSSPYELTYEFNPSTGNMVQVAAKESPTIDSTDPAKIQQLQEKYWNIQGAARFTYYFSENCSMALSDGNVLISTTDSVFRTPHCIDLLKPGTKSAYETLSKRFNTSTFPNMQQTRYTEAITSPLPYSIYPCNVAYAPTGEFFTAAGASTATTPKIFFREVSGEYSERSTMTNLLIANVKSRPLSNAVYTTGLDYRVPMLTVTGDVTYISNLGTGGFGATSLGVGNEGRLWSNPHTAWDKVRKSDRSVVIPRLFSNSKKSSTEWNFAPTSFVTYPDAIVKALAKALIPTAYANTPDSFVTIADVNTITNATSSSPVIVQVVYGDVANQTRRHVVATIKPTYDKTDASNWLVTGYTVVSTNDAVGRESQVDLTSTSWAVSFGRTNGQGENTVALYYSGSTIRVCFNTQISTNNIGNAALCGSVFTVDVNTHVISDRLQYSQSWEGNDNVVVVPKIGTGTKYAPSYSGSTAEIVYTASGAYGRISCYPDPAWSLFFQSDIAVIFNGKTYQLSAGVVDLRTVKAAPANSTFYVYARLVNGVAQYVISETKTFDTIYNIWIGTVVTNASQILSISRSNVLLMNGSRVSEVKRGGAIPAAAGAIGEEGSFAWLHSSEVIQS